MSTVDLAIKMYAARAANDLQATLAYFHADAAFSISGDAGATPIACDVCGEGAFAAALEGLIAEWPWVEQEILETVEEGDRVAVRHRIGARNARSGEIVETVLFDLIEIRDGKVSRMVQHLDTELVARKTPA